MISIFSKLWKPLFLVAETMCKLWSPSLGQLWQTCQRLVQRPTDLNLPCQERLRLVIYTRIRSFGLWYLHYQTGVDDKLWIKHNFPLIPITRPLIPFEYVMDLANTKESLLVGIWLLSWLLKQSYRREILLYSRGMFRINKG